MAPNEVKKREHMLVGKYGGIEIKLGGKECKILNSDEILAVVDQSFDFAVSRRPCV